VKEGRTIQELAVEATRRNEAKRDFVADTRNLQVQPIMQKVEASADTPAEPHFLPTPERLQIVVADEPFEITPHTHGQMAQRLKIDKRYYDRMLAEAPALLAHNVNHWFQHAPDRRMIRTLDGMGRAFLSDRYRRIDAFDLLEWTLPVIAEDMPNVKILSCELTDRKLFVKAFFENMELEVKRQGKVGDVVRAGFQYGTSEIGLGSVFVEPMVEVLACVNGMVVMDNSGIRRRHVGRRTGNGDGDAVEIFADDTLQADDKALMLKVRDTLKAVIDETKFRAMVERFQAAAENRLADPIKTAEVLQQQFRLTDDDRGSILGHLVEGGDLSQWGLANAVTRHSQDVESYDKASDFEKLGGQIIELDASAWKQLAEPVN
jgi:hypothetical protein